MGEADVLRLLTSGDTRALGAVVGIAYANRDQLGPAWWRLLQAGVLWSGLILLTPHHGDGEDAERAWSGWLARLRRFPLRGKDANPDSLDFKRVAAGCGRLEFYREMRLYTSGERTFGGPLRLDGLRWIAAILKAKNPSNHWYREGTGNALVEPVAAALGSDAQALSKDAEAQQALVAVAAALAAKNIPAALALQERIKLLRC